MQSVPFTDAENTAIRYYAGYPAYAAFGYWLSPDSATLKAQTDGMSDTEQATIRTEFLAVLPGLKTAIDGASALLMVDRAGPFRRNQQEIPERIRLYNSLRRRMCQFIGCEPGPDLRGGVVRT